MAKASVEVLSALLRTITRIEKSNEYQWGHMGSCNCGFLAQELTMLKKEEIHSRAMKGYGDWTEQLNDYCPTSGLPMDEVISQMLLAGFDSDDLKHLEKLSAPKILESFPLAERNLKHNQKTDVILYLKAWAQLVEQELLANLQLPDLEMQNSVPVQR
jgi:hypothetical protein